MNADLIRRRRLALGRSRRAVAREVGLSEGAVARLESGAGADEWTLRQLRSLSAALGLDIAEVVGVEPPRPELGSDVEVLGAMLVELPRMVHTSTLACATGWQLARVNTALDALDGRLRPLGLRVHRLRGTVAIRSVRRSTDAQTFKALHQRDLARQGLTRSQVALLQAVTVGSVDEQRFTDNDRLTYASLLNAGLIEERDGAPHLTEAARESLQVSNARAA
jgi:transcriptional regulator with XRE-family HTH domain